MATAVKPVPADVQPQVAAVTDNARKVLERRYLIRDHESGNVVETPEQLFWRVASNIAQADALYGATAEQVEQTAREFYEVMANLAFQPNTPCLVNAGRELQQLAACFVLPVEDDLHSIFETIKHAALIHKSGGGTGFSFSRIRPKGDMVLTTSGVASGPVSFMKVYDAATEAVKQGGVRRGANMAILSIEHPDIEEFISMKDDLNVLNNFNISVAITENFMHCVEHDLDHELKNPRTGEVVRKIRARVLFEKIVDSAWRTGEPGIVFMDRINATTNTTPQVGMIESTNPCGEQPLLPYESCNLGSINLNMVMVDGPDGKPVIDWTMLRKLARTGVHFLDNIVDMNKYPLPQIEEITHRNRRIGLGVMGWADILFKMEIGYNTPEAVALAEEVMRVIEDEAHKTSQELAEARGCFANWEGSIFQKQGKKMRNCGVTTIAPTGTISVIAGASSGIEPLFALAFFRNVMDGTKLPEVNSYFREIAEREGWGSPEVYTAVAEHGTCQGVPGVPEKWQQVFVTAHDITPEWHIRMQAAWQHNTDAAISKTCNFRNEATREEIEEVYRLAYKLGCKGVTVYRDGCRFNQVLNTGSTPTPEKAVEPKAEAPKEQAEPVLTINNDSFAAQLYAVQASSKAHPTWTTLCVSMEHGYPEVLPRPLPPAEEQLWAQEFRVETPLGNMRMFVSEVDGKPFEVFIMIGRSGSDVMAFTEAIGRLLSIALRAGIPVAVLADQLRDVGGRSSVGFGPNRIVSVPDAIAKVLTRSYINNPGHGHNGPNGNGNGHSSSNGNGSVKPELVTMAVNGTAQGEAEVSPALAAIRNTRTLREICPSCKNATLEYTEGCKKCQCGYSEC